MNILHLFLHGPVWSVLATLEAKTGSQPVMTHLFPTLLPGVRHRGGSVIKPTSISGNIHPTVWQLTTSPQYTLGAPPRSGVRGISGHAEHTFSRVAEKVVSPSFLSIFEANQSVFKRTTMHFTVGQKLCFGFGFGLFSLKNRLFSPTRHPVLVACPVTAGNMIPAVVMGCFASKTVCFSLPDTRSGRPARVGQKLCFGFGFGLFCLKYRLFSPTRHTVLLACPGRPET